jgi:Fe-S cluster assembly protein SufD
MVKFLNSQHFGEHTSSYHTEIFTLDDNSHLEYDIISTGSKSSMWDSSFNLVGNGAEVNANGLIITQNKQFIGNKMSIYHNASKTNSNLSMKSILKDKSKTLFVGSIKIPRDSQKCNGYQKCDNLILGDKARADVIPRLEIIADDVKCSHGATVGSIDAEKLFYLTSRGLSKEKAENFIIKSFYNDVLGKMSILNKERYLKKDILSKLKEELFASKKE